MDRDKWKAGVEIENAVELASLEELGEYKKRRAANPTRRVADLVSTEPLTWWYTYTLIRETKRLRWLTVVLTVLTAVLAVLTARLALL